MNYAETLDYLYTQLPMFQRQGPVAFKKDLRNTLALCAALENPQHKFKSIHLAGTNGKGTCSHILASLLQRPGQKIGLYTSPHYKDFRERIKVNGQLMPKAEVVDFVASHKDVFEEIRPSFFEITVAMAFWYFAKVGVDYAVIETGLGGRLDSTNILQPELCLITNISLDHQSMLGNTLPKIAKEKAGIIKKNTPIVIGEYQETVHSVFSKKAKKEGSPLYLAKDICQVSNYQYNLTAASFEVKFQKKRKFEIKTDLIGNYQAKNIQSALAAYAQLLNENKRSLDLAWIQKALAKVRKRTYYLGRWQVLQKRNPAILCDSAHNKAGIQMLLSATEQSYDQLHIIFGTVNDKDLSPIFSLLPSKARYYFAKANIPRGMPAPQLLSIANENGLTGQGYSSVRRALAAAKQRAGKNDLILVCGSIYVVAEVL